MARVRFPLGVIDVALEVVDEDTRSARGINDVQTARLMPRHVRQGLVDRASESSRWGIGAS